MLLRHVVILFRLFMHYCLPRRQARRAASALPENLGRDGGTGDVVCGVTIPVSVVGWHFVTSCVTCPNFGGMGKLHYLCEAPVTVEAC